MKKMLLVLSALALVACGGGDTEKKGKAESEKDDSGMYTKVSVTMKGDKIEKININEWYPEKDNWKKELKEDYDMKKASPIKKEWYEQIAFLEDYIKENGVDDIKTKDGKATSDDILAGCTINIDSYIKTTKAAIENAE